MTRSLSIPETEPPRTKIRSRYTTPVFAIVSIWLGLSLLTSLGPLPSTLPTTWVYSVEVAATKWFVWILFVPLIVRFDRMIVRPSDAVIRRLLFHVPMALAVAVATNYVSTLAVRMVGLEAGVLPSPMQVIRSSWRGGYLMHLMIYFAIVGIYSAFDYYTRLNERKLHDAELERLVSESKLSNLRAQLQPHFLFNTLNTISAHIERQPKLARRILEQLANLLRLCVEHSAEEEISLRSEIQFLKEYCALQATRYEGNLEIDLRVDENVMNALVPTFVFQPLVENSIRYGAAAGSGRGVIEVSAWPEGDRLKLRVRDDGAGLPVNWDPELSNGVGIANTRERLRWLYGDAGQQFQIANNVNFPGVCVDMTIPLHRAVEQDRTVNVRYEPIDTNR